MSARYRYVVDHGDIFRMSSPRYRCYLLAGRDGDKFPEAADFGVYIGSALTVNNLTSSEFSEAYNREVGLLNDPLANSCPTCGADQGQACLSLQKRWENPMSRTVGIGNNGWRKTPHPERVLNARGR